MAAPPTAAYARPHRKPRSLLAAALGGAIVFAFLGGSIFDISATGSLMPVILVAGVLVVGLFGFGTWLVILAVDHEPHRQRLPLARAAIVIGLGLALFLFAINLYNASLNFVGLLIS